MDAVLLHRWQFGFTVTYHYLFPQMTMGLALFILLLKTFALRRGDLHYDECAAFWTRIFAISFTMGVVTGIPMEFQFGTNWARFSRYAGNVIGQTLAMEGVFAFFLESAFLGLLLYGRDRLGARGHWVAALALFVGSWLSGWFIVATNAWMQHPVGHVDDGAGNLQLGSLTALLTNEWLPWQYAHTMAGATVTGSFVLAGVGAFYLLSGVHVAHARTFVRFGVIVGTIASLLLIYPTGDRQGQNVARHQPATLAAMEGLFHTARPAPLALVGQPDMERLELDNPLQIPDMLSFLTYRRWSAPVKGLTDFPRELWPTNVPLLYYCYHIMVGLGTFFVAGLAVAAWLLWRGRLYTSRVGLWILLLLSPFPFVANSAGWLTAELGRQPWVAYGLLRTEHGTSEVVTDGNVLFTLIGFMGLYTMLSLLFVIFAYRELSRGPS
jgi:cytochrome bd ubiquinol oxidase subunit I